MKTVQMHLSLEGTWMTCSKSVVDPDTQLAFVFWSGVEASDVLPHIHSLRARIPAATIVGCSTGGIIQDRLLLEEGLSATLVSFDDTQVQTFRANICDHNDSEELGASLAEQIPTRDLVHVLVFSDGLQINGSRLALGLDRYISGNVSITGGLAADGMRFCQTALLFNDELLTGEVLAIAFYGTKLRVGFGSQGGFEPFGPERLITASEDNILHEIDGESALDLYERYLGKHARNLPASGHLFPLGLRSEEGQQVIIRSIMGVDRNAQSLLFSGDMPVGTTVQLMKSNIDSLLDGAREAAQNARLTGHNSLALLVSCMGRKQGLRQFTEEEIDAVQSALPHGTPMTGFYSYGEIAPCGPNQPCMLHNQTMTVTVFGEEN